MIIACADGQVGQREYPDSEGKKTCARFILACGGRMAGHILNRLRDFELWWYCAMFGGYEVHFSSLEPPLALPWPFTEYPPIPGRGVHISGNL